MADLTRVVGRDELPRALTWLYEAIEHGRVEPVQDAAGMRYVFRGTRRRDDHDRGDRGAPGTSRSTAA